MPRGKIANVVPQFVEEMLTRHQADAWTNQIRPMADKRRFTRNLAAAAAAFAVATASGGSLMAQAPRADGDATAAVNKRIIERHFAAWRDRTGSPFDLLTDSATWTIVGRSAAAGTYRGREAFLARVIRPFNARMREGLRPEIRRLHADGNTVIVFFDAEAPARDGVPYRNTYAWLLEMKDGRIVEAWAFFDSITFNELWSRVTPQ